MDSHFKIFREDLVKLHIQFNNALIQSKSQAFLPAKKVALLASKYINQNPLLLYQMISKNLGKTNVNWDDLLKCFQQQLSLSYTVLKAQNKKYSISQTKWKNSLQFNKIIQYVKLKQTNLIQKIVKPNLNINISSYSNVSDILAVAFQKQIMFYVIQDQTIANNFQFKYQNVEAKILKKDNQRQIKLREMNMQRESFDRVTPINNFRMNSTHYKSSEHVHEKSRRSQQKFMQEDSQKLSRRNSRLISSASSQISGLKRNKTQIGAGDWRKKQTSKIQHKTVKIRNNTTKKVFQYFQEATLQNSISIVNAFVQSRNNFQKYMQIDKHLLQKQRKQQIQHVQANKGVKNFAKEVQKMKKISKSLTKDRRFSLSSYHHEQSQALQGQQLFSTNNNHRHGFVSHNSLSKQQSSNTKLLEESTVAIISFSFFLNYLLVSLVNRQVRLYRVKKNLHRLKQELIYEKVSQNIANYVLLYRSIFKNTINMIICTSKNQSHLLRVYEIPSQILNPTSFAFKRSEKQGKQIKQIFSCHINFCPMFQDILPYGVVGFNQKGNLSIIALNSTNQLSSEVKLFQKNFTNLTSGVRVSFCGCRIHTNLLSIYMICNGGFIYLIDRLTASIKLQRKISLGKLLDIILIKSSSQLLTISQKGQLCIVNSFNLQIMYNFQTYTNIQDDTRLLSIQENKILVYSSKNVGVIQLQQNQQKLFEYQKPLKVYKNRVKLKQQNKVQETTNKKKVQELVTQNLQKYQLVKKSNKILFVSSPVSQQPYIMIGLKRGQIMVYNEKLDYVGSYFVPNVKEVIQCKMNKKLHYLAVHYQSNTIQIVNLYNQNLIARMQEESAQKYKAKTRQSTNNTSNLSQIEYLNISFFNQKVQEQFFIILTNQYKIYLYDRKGQKTKIVSIADYYLIESKQVKSKGNESQVQVIFKSIKIKSSLFRHQQLIVGNQKGDILIHQKQNFTCKKTLKLSYYPIVDIRLACISQQSFPHKTQILCQSKNNHIYLLNTSNQIFKSVYIPQNDILGLNLKGFTDKIVVYDHQQNYQKLVKLVDKDQNEIQKIEQHTQHSYLIQSTQKKVNQHRANQRTYLKTFTTQQFQKRMCSYLFLPKNMLVVITQNESLIIAKTYQTLEETTENGTQFQLFKQTILK